MLSLSFSFLLPKSEIYVSNDLLTYYMAVLPSYRTQFIDLHGKSIDWFLYEGNTGI